MHYFRWTASAVLASAALALSACAGGGMSSTTPAGPVVNGVAGAMHASQGKHLTVVSHYNSVPTCNFSQFPDGCFSFSQTSGLTVNWCFGTQADPCEDTSQLSGWNGLVTRIATGLTATRILVAYSGPFPCDGFVCPVGSGTFETDAMTVRNNRPPQRANNYIDQQVVNACIGTSCADLAKIGINIVNSPPARHRH